MLEKALGQDHKSVASSLAKLAQFYWKNAKQSATDFQFKRSLRAYESPLGRKVPGMVPILEQFAAYLENTGRSDDAKKYRERISEIHTLNNS